MPPTHWILAIILLALRAFGFDPIDMAFLPDSEPISLEASVISHSVSNFAATIEVRPGTTMPVWAKRIILSLRADCPSAETPENDACRAAGIYPADIDHTVPDRWGGTTTYAADNSTTTWGCRMGSVSAGGDDLTADCSKTIESAGSLRTESTVYDNCYVLAHVRPVVMTAGVDKIKPPPPTKATFNNDEVVTLSADALISIYSEFISSDGCPASETVMFAGSVQPGQTETAPSSASPTNGGSDENAGARRFGGNPLGAWAGIGVTGLILGL